MTSTSEARTLSERMGKRLSDDLGLPSDAANVVSSLLLAREDAVSLEDLERVLRRPIGRLGTSVDLLRRLGVIQRGERRFAAFTRGTPGLRDLLRRMAAAYRKGGMEALETVHWRRVETSASYRRLLRWLGKLLPLDAVAEFGSQLDRDLETSPLWEASTRALSRLNDRWEIDIPDATREIIASKPLIVYGNHPSMLTPFLVAAALEREDLKFVSCRYVSQLIPNLERDIFPVDPTYDRSAREGLKTGFSHMLTMALLYRFDEGVDIEQAREQNLSSIQAAAEHVSHGGVSLIFPGAGGTRVWYPGLGVLIKEVLRNEPDTDVYLVPIHEAHSSNLRLYRALSKKRRGFGRRPPLSLHVGQPRPLRYEGFSLSQKPREIAHQLHWAYRRHDAAE